jgi:hypothetical protein
MRGHRGHSYPAFCLPPNRGAGDGVFNQSLAQQGDTGWQAFDFPHARARVCV